VINGIPVLAHHATNVMNRTPEPCHAEARTPWSSHTWSFQTGQAMPEDDPAFRLGTRSHPEA